MCCTKVNFKFNMNANYPIIPKDEFSIDEEFPMISLISSSLFPTDSDMGFLLPQNFPKEHEEDPEPSPEAENKENVSPNSDSLASTTTPSKQSNRTRSHINSSNERTPLSDISHHFGPKRKKVEVFFKF